MCVGIVARTTRSRTSEVFLFRLTELVLSEVEGLDEFFFS